jgi:hypothetical protein
VLKSQPYHLGLCANLGYRINCFQLTASAATACERNLPASTTRYTSSVADCYNLLMKKETESKTSVKAGENKDSKSDESESRQSDEAAGSEAQADEDTIRPYGKKIGEGPDNLRQREQWFQQRTGSRK